MPKPFTGHIDVIQRNAIRSWTLLEPKCEVIVFGDEEGVAQATTDLGVRHIPEVKRNERGTPLLNYLFARVQDESESDLFCFVNSDIMLTSAFMDSVEVISRRWREFLMVGRRWNVDITEPWPFEAEDWESKLLDFVSQNGKLFTADAIDLFVFPRGFWGDIPPFALGRPAYDNWLIYKARSLGAPVVDATQVVTVVHQNHNYGHYQGGQKAIWEGPEAERNRELAGGYDYIFDLNDSTWKLASAGLQRALGTEQLYRRFRRIPVLHAQTYRLIRPFVYFVNLGRRLVRKCLHPIAGLMGRR